MNSPSPPGPVTPATWVVGEKGMLGLKKRHRRENSLVKTQRAAVSDGSDPGYRIRAKNAGLTLCEEEPHLGLFRDETQCSSATSSPVDGMHQKELKTPTRVN